MEETMHTYLIEPLAPLIVRSGRPFDDQAGADSARFPPPSTLAGALRTAHAESAGKAFTPALAEIAVAGPLPVKLGENGKAVSLLVPKPADALYFKDAAGGGSRLVRALPQQMSAGEGCDLPNGLLPVQLCEAVQGKPASGPRWWSLDDLLAFRNLGLPPPGLDEITRRGWSPPEDEIRTHVAIDHATRAAEASKLFQTAGLSFSDRLDAGKIFPSSRIAMIGCVAGTVGTGVVTLGGERRLSAITNAPSGIWPAPPANLPAQISAAGGFSLTLLTPALFAEGWRPVWLGTDLQGTPPGCDGLRVKLRAAALERWQAHSGWDLASQHPRAGRKLIPAGAVYWFDIVEATEPALARLWFAAISDHKQDILDGFGLALPQPWQPVQTKN